MNRCHLHPFRSVSACVPNGRHLLALTLATIVVGQPLPAWAKSVAVDNLIKAALAGHPALVAAQETASAQQARASGAASPYWPQVSLATSSAETTQVSQAQNTSAPFNLSQVGLTVRQQLWDFGKTAAEVAAAEASAEAQRNQAALQRVEIAFGVRKAYLDWLRFRGLQAQAEARLAAAKALFAQAEAFWKAGRKPKIDVTRADAGLQVARADFITASNSVLAATFTLGMATGQPVGLHDEPVTPVVPPVAQMPLVTLRQLALKHPSLQVGSARRQQSEANRERADRAYWPDILASADYGLRARDLAPSQNWGVGVTMNVNVFRGFAEQREQDASAAQVRASIADVHDRQLQVAGGVERSYLTVAGARERLAAVAAAVTSAQANLTLAEGRYRAGVGSVIEVSDAQLLLSNAQADRVRAEADYHQAIADLLRSVGQTGIDG